MRRIIILAISILLSLNMLSQDGYWFGSTWVELTPVGNDIMLDNHSGRVKASSFFCLDEEETIGPISSKANLNRLTTASEIERNWKLEIYDMRDASLVCAREVVGDKTIINTAGWNAGTYAIRAICGEQVFTEKLLVK